MLSLLPNEGPLLLTKRPLLCSISQVRLRFSSRMGFIYLFTCDGIWRAVGGAPSGRADLFLGTAVS